MLIALNLFLINGNILPINKHSLLILIIINMENKYIYQVNGQSLNKDLLIASYGAFLSDVVSKIEDKGIFPHSFVRVSNLDYEGEVPGIEYFLGITEEQYQEYCIAYTDKNWNLREEVEKYLLKDSIILYEVLSTFNKLVYETFDVNISKYPTLSSLSFGIFRSRYLSKNKICLLDGDVYKYIYIFNTYTF